MTIAVDMGRKATKTNKQKYIESNQTKICLYMIEKMLTGSNESTQTNKQTNK